MTAVSKVPTSVRLRKRQNCLQAQRFGQRVFSSREVESTSDWAEELADAGAEEGTVTVGQTQTAGRGRLGRKWFSPKDGLWFSIILRPDLKASEAPKLVFVASLAVAEVLNQRYGLRTETKWPNDVLVGGRKLCGVNAEVKTKGGKVDYVILGVGVNANFSVEDALPGSLKTVATSVQEELGRKISLERLLKTLLQKIGVLYDGCVKAGFNPMLKRWKTYAGFLGRSVVVSDQPERLSGLALDVDAEGALVLRLEDGTKRRIFAGDVVLDSCQTQ